MAATRDPNVVSFKRGSPETAPTLRITLPLDLDRLPAVLGALTVASQLATRVSLKREFGDETVLQGIGEIFTAFDSLTCL